MECRRTESTGTKPRSGAPWPCDPKAQLRRLPALFAEEESGHGPSSQSRDVQDPGRRREARAGGAVFQTALGRSGPKNGTGPKEVSRAARAAVGFMSISRVLHGRFTRLSQPGTWLKRHHSRI